MSDINPKWKLFDYLKTLPAIIFVLIIFYFSSLSNPYPSPPPVPTIIFLNPLLHLFEFALLTFLLFYGFFSKTKVIFIIIVSVTYAIIDEIHQYFVPNRYFDLFDLFIDFIGVILGFFSYLVVNRLYKKCKKKSEDDSL
ncbi:MAG: VanZ family protein [Candidatus Thorarchaeota archaeon]